MEGSTERTVTGLEHRGSFRARGSIPQPSANSRRVNRRGRRACLLNSASLRA